jgi:hypothetical protein
MKGKNKKNDPIPESFANEEEAGEFWDTHSTADYEECLESVNMTIDIKRSHYEIEIDKEIFMALMKYAQKTHQSMTGLASSILKEKLVSA